MGKGASISAGAGYGATTALFTSERPSQDFSPAETRPCINRRPDSEGVQLGMINVTWLFFTRPLACLSGDFAWNTGQLQFEDNLSKVMRLDMTPVISFPARQAV